MSQSFLEIIQLPDGQVVLRRVDADREDEPLVTLNFSEEAKLYLGEALLDVSKAMIGTGVQLVTRMFEQEMESDEPRVIH